jgi:hypothetical protein
MAIILTNELPQGRGSVAGKAKPRWNLFDRVTGLVLKGAKLEGQLLPNCQDASKF